MTCSRRPLHMALGRGWHQRKEYQRAFEHYQAGNRLRADLLGYDPGGLTREVDQFIDIAGPDFFAALTRERAQFPCFWSAFRVLAQPFLSKC